MPALPSGPSLVRGCGHPSPHRPLTLTEEHLFIYILLAFPPPRACTMFPWYKHPVKPPVVAPRLCLAPWHSLPYTRGWLYPKCVGAQSGLFSHGSIPTGFSEQWCMAGTLWPAQGSATECEGGGTLSQAELLGPGSWKPSLG